VVVVVVVMVGGWVTVRKTMQMMKIMMLWH